jgi:hypothetical protein
MSGRSSDRAAMNVTSSLKTDTVDKKAVYADAGILAFADQELCDAAHSSFVSHASELASIEVVGEGIRAARGCMAVRTAAAR